jgi:crotonobetainyl-CoA:carnitine CoA-transferase CaiB-like acyl-CoA transferase
MMYITGDGSRQPLVHGGSQAAHLSGVNAASACLAAHMLAKTTGRGQRIDISEQEVIATTIFPALNIYSHTGGVMKRAPSGIANLVNSSPMETNDGYIMPSYAGLGDFQALAAFLEVPELGDERFSTPERRAANAEEIDELAGPAFR